MRQILVGFFVVAACAHDDEVRRDEFDAMRSELGQMRQAQNEARQSQDGLREALRDLARVMRPRTDGEETRGESGEAPPVGEPPPPPVPARIIQPYPESWEFYLAESPDGWGQNALSVEWKNDVPGCFMEVTFAGKPARVLTRDGQPAPGTVWTVREGSRLRPASLIPPEETVYFLRDRPERQNWTARCYTGPPRLVQMDVVGGGRQAFPALQFTSEARGEIWGDKRRRIRLTRLHMSHREAVF